MYEKGLNKVNNTEDSGWLYVPDDRPTRYCDIFSFRGFERWAGLRCADSPGDTF